MGFGVSKFDGAGSWSRVACCEDYEIARDISFDLKDQGVIPGPSLWYDLTELSIGQFRNANSLIDSLPDMPADIWDHLAQATDHQTVSAIAAACKVEPTASSWPYVLANTNAEVQRAVIWSLIVLLPPPRQLFLEEFEEAVLLARVIDNEMAPIVVWSVLARRPLWADAIWRSLCCYTSASAAQKAADELYRRGNPPPSDLWSLLPACKGDGVLKGLLDALVDTPIDPSNEQAVCERLQSVKVVQPSDRWQLAVTSNCRPFTDHLIANQVQPKAGLWRVLADLPVDRLELLQKLDVLPSQPRSVWSAIAKSDERETVAHLLGIVEVELSAIWEADVIERLVQLQLWEAVGLVKEDRVAGFVIAGLINGRYMPLSRLSMSPKRATMVWRALTKAGSEQAVDLIGLCLPLPTVRFWYEAVASPLFEVIARQLALKLKWPTDLEQTKIPVAYRYLFLRPASARKNSPLRKSSKPC